LAVLLSWFVLTIADKNDFGSINDSFEFEREASERRLAKDLTRIDFDLRARTVNVNHDLS
jgi:hypothetical protein